MIHGTTNSGFCYEVDEKRLDDYELLEALSSVDNGNGQDIVVVNKLLLGENQLKALKAHLRKDGVVSLRDMIAEIKDIFEGCKPIKNS